MSIKHHFVEERERKSGGVNEQPEQKVIKDDYGKRRRRQEGLQHIDSHRQGRRRKQSFSLQLGWGASQPLPAFPASGEGRPTIPKLQAAGRGAGASDGPAAANRKSLVSAPTSQIPANYSDTRPVLKGSFKRGFRAPLVDSSPLTPWFRPYTAVTYITSLL